MENKDHLLTENLEALVRGRRSVRTFDKNGIDEATLAKLTGDIAELDSPFDLPITCRLVNAAEEHLKCPVVEGTDLYITIKTLRRPHFEEAVGYAFERFVLYAQSLGIGTTWIGGTMDREAFERAAGVAANEVMPCITPIGVPAKKMSLREKAMRTGVRADSRLSFDQIFFDGTFDKPLKEASAGELHFPLEMVRLSPSAVNKQPWRVVISERAAHFYVKHAKGFSEGTAGDMQKIDIGIAMCHFALAMEKQGRAVRFVTEAPDLSAASDLEYIAGYEFIS